MNNKLSTDPAFLISFVGGLFLGCLLYLLLILNNDLIFCFELICYSHFLEISSLPISVIAGGMALAAFRATIFRSNQTRAQIEETIEQNKFKNYIDHKKELMSLLDMLESAHSVIIINRPHLYKNIFPENSPVCVKFDSKEVDCSRSWLDFQLDEFNNLINEYNEIGMNICVNDTSLSNKTIARWLSSYLIFINQLEITIPKSQMVSGNYKSMFSGVDKLNLIPPNIGESFYIVSEYFTHLSSFALPSRNERIKINSIASFDTRFDEKLKIFLGDET